MSRRLARLGRLLRRREDAAAVARAAAAQRTAAAEQTVARADAASRAPTTEPRQLTPLELQSLRLRGLGAVADLERARAALADRREEEAEAERDRSVAAVRRRSVERLAERRQTVAVREAAVASQRSLDALAVLRRSRP